MEAARTVNCPSLTALFAEQSRTDEDYLRFKFPEQLEEVHLVEGEQSELEQEAKPLSHAGEIKAALPHRTVFFSDEGGLLSFLKDNLNTLNNLRKVYQPAGELSDRMESAYIELKDISQEVSAQGESIEFNPTRLDEVNDRLNLIYSLQQKHRVQTLEELMALADQYRSKLSEITSYDDRIAELTARKEAQYERVKKQATVLTKPVRQPPVKWRNNWLNGWSRWVCPTSASKWKWD